MMSSKGIPLSSAPSFTQRIANVGASVARTFESLAYRDFRLLWFASLATSLAIQIQIYARGWLIFDLTDSELALTWVMLAFWAPSSLFAFLGAALGDRVRKKTIMVGAQVASMLSALAFGTLILLGEVNFWYFVIFGFINGTVLALSMPTRTAVMPDLVEPKHLTNALALSGSTFNLSRVVGIAFGGVLLSTFLIPYFSPATSVGILFLLISALYGSSIIGTSMIHYQGEPSRDRKKSLNQDFREGVSYIWNSRVLIGLLLMGLITTVFGFSAQFLLPAFNGRVFDGDTGILSALLVALGLGAVLGGLAVARFGDTGYKGRLMFVLATLWALSLAFLAQTTQLWLAVVALILVGASSAGLSSLNLSVIQLLVSVEMRGRVMAITWASFGMMPVGMIPLGFLAEAVSVQAAFLTCAGLMLLGIVCIHFISPQVIRIRRGHKDHSTKSKLTEGRGEKIPDPFTTSSTG